MKKITKLMLALVLLAVGAGVNSVKAERVNGSLSVATGATWDATTSTMGFTAVNGWQILFTGLPSGNITTYTKIHATLSDFSDNLDKIRLRIKDKGDKYADYNLVAGENNIDLATLKNENPDCDFTNIADITIWSPTAPKTGYTIDGNNPASVKIKDVYMERPNQPFVVSTGGFGDEITSLEDITDGTKFAIGDGDNAMCWTKASVDAQKTNVKNVPTDSYYYYKLEKIAGLDTDNDGNAEDDNYRILIVNASNEAAVVGWNFGPYLNYSRYGHLFAATAREKEGNDSYTYGWDGDYYAIWKVDYSEGNGFSLKNVGINKYATVGGSSDNVTYLKFYKSIDFTDTTKYPANDEIFAISKASGYNAETGVGNNMQWTFNTPIDLSNWDYLVIGLGNTAANGSHRITLTDSNDKSVSGDDYKGEEAGTGAGMWFDYWNNQSIIAISMDKLNVSNELNIYEITSLSISGEVTPTVAYLTSYANPKLTSRGRWTTYVDGDVVRENTETGKFGTICLPYVASYAGAEVYSIASKSESGVTLEKVTGLLEAGKPYFYKSSDEIGKNNEGAVRNVNFFRADFEAYDAATPVENNGLIGTFTGTTAPQGENYYVLSSNELYQVDSDVTVGANKAYIDASKVTNQSEAKSRAFINFEGQATGIAAIENNDAVNAITNAAIFNLNGQRVMNPTRGIYIVNGKKLFIK